MPQLAGSAVLNAAAYNHSLDMGQRGYFEHDTPDGVTPTDRAQAAGYPGQVAENIAAGNETAQATFEQWRTSPDHNANMLADNAVIGIGRVFVEGSEFGWYWTIKFGGIADEPPANCG
ncbi:MAG: CAP domain-containing protein [Thermomicrobiales bacterium]